MKSIRTIFNIGNGPSSSHTMGPSNACKYILNKYKDIKKVTVTLTGSLAETGKGHLTDAVIHLRLEKINHEVIFDYDTRYPHPNTLVFDVEDNIGNKYKEIIESIGGGTIIVTNAPKEDIKEVYPHKSLKEILEYCDKNNLSLADYVRKFEDKDINKYASNLLDKWKQITMDGISRDGVIPGKLGIQRKSHFMYDNFLKQYHPRNKRNYDLIMMICATANGEQNASGEEVITAPTCGSCGVIPGVLGFLTASNNKRKDIIDGVLVAGLIGIISKTNGSISGAECGCQAEIGVACSMGAALISACKHLPNNKIAQAAEIALEHSLGLTCDPVGGYVIIPCIERNGMFALKARAAYSMATLIPSETEVISFDDALATMVQTGKDLQTGYRETAQKGLAKLKLENRGS